MTIKQRVTYNGDIINLVLYMKVCKRCNLEKKEEDFPKHKLYIRKVCKECEKPNTGRFKKGCKSLSPFLKGHIPWSKGKNISDEHRKKCGLKNIGRKLTKEHKAKLSKIMRAKGKSKLSCNYKDWRNAVLEKYNYECSECGNNEIENLCAHHIIPWKDNIELRFDVDNGKLLCRACHGKLEGFQKGNIPDNVFKKGQIPWNKKVK